MRYFFILLLFLGSTGCGRGASTTTLKTTTKEGCSLYEYENRWEDVYFVTCRGSTTRKVNEGKLIKTVRVPTEVLENE